jgi:hypothetical protein
MSVLAWSFKSSRVKKRLKKTPPRKTARNLPPLSQSRVPQRRKRRRETLRKLTRPRSLRSAR